MTRVWWTLCVALFLLATPRQAAAATKVCAYGSVTTSDSGFTIPAGPNAGDTEDHWQNGQTLITVNGLKITVARSGTSYSGNLDNTGCFTVPVSTQYSDWSISFHTSMQITDGPSGTFLKVKNDRSATTVGSWYTTTYTNRTIQPNMTHYIFDVGTGIKEFTTHFAAAHTIRRAGADVDNVEYWVGMDNTCCVNPPPPGCGGSSAHYNIGGQANGSITSGKHFIKIDNCGTDPHSSRKFVVSHEVGHAIAALHYGKKSYAFNGSEPGGDTSLADSTIDNQCVNVNTSYSTDTLEYNGIGFREGIAHFLAAAAWNNKHDEGECPLPFPGCTGEEGSFTWGSSKKVYDIERYSQGSGTVSGGFRDNVCCNGVGECASTGGGVGVTADWMNFFWDFYTDGSCSAYPFGANLLDILEIYARARGAVANLSFSQRSAWWTESYAVAAAATNTCMQGRYNNWGNWNGVDNL